MELYEALYTTRAMRRVGPDPIPQDVISLIIDAAVRSPSGGNTQNWRFVTVSDRATMGRLGELYSSAWQTLQATVYSGRIEQAEGAGDEQTLRVIRSSQWLADHFAEVPLVVLPYHRNDPSGASIYPAVWSMMLAARGKGVGATLTTILGIFKQQEVADLLGVPLDKGWTNAAAVTFGYPLGRWDVAARRPSHEVVYEEAWGREPSWTADGPLWPAD
jgi:nitroreductase